MPGMDGTGLLFERLVPFFRESVRFEVVRYSTSALFIRGARDRLIGADALMKMRAMRVETIDARK